MHAHTCMHTHTHTHTHAHACTHTHARTHARTHAQTHTHQWISHLACSNWLLRLAGYPVISTGLQNTMKTCVSLSPFRPSFDQIKFIFLSFFSFFFFCRSLFTGLVYTKTIITGNWVFYQNLACVVGGLRRFKKERKSDEGKGAGARRGLFPSLPSSLFRFIVSDLSDFEIFSTHTVKSRL